MPSCIVKGYRMVLELVKMVRDGKYADVHPDMIDDYSRGGFSIVKRKEPEIKKPENKEPIIRTISKAKKRK